MKLVPFLFASFFLGWISSKIHARKESRFLTQVADNAIAFADKEAKSIVERADREAKELLKETKNKQEELDRQLMHLAKQQRTVEQEVQKQSHEKKKFIEKQKALSEKELFIENKIAKIAGFSREEALEQLVSKKQEEIDTIISSYYFEKKENAQKESLLVGQNLIITCLNRLPQKQFFDAHVTKIALPNQKVIAKIIGKEGKNIRYLEDITNVRIAIEDKESILILSSFDPKKRYIAEKTVLDLLESTLITEESIYKTYLSTVENISDHFKQLGFTSAKEVGIFDFHPQLLLHLGQLSLHYSLGQNTLSHSIEVSQLMGMLASELGLNVERAKRIGLLHDIGKALELSQGETHARAGERLALAYKEQLLIANGIGCHHGEIEPLSQEALLCSVADKLSAGQALARSEKKQDFFERQQSIEELCMGFSGVEKVFSCKSGQKIHVFVSPSEIDDLTACFLAKKIRDTIRNERSKDVEVSVIRRTVAIG